MKNHQVCSTQTFFSEIGKYQPLTREEEATEIENIIRFREMLAIASASTNSTITFYLDLLKIRDSLARKTGRKIQTPQWALAANISVEKLNLIKRAAYDEWAKIAQITVEQLSSIEKNGRLAREKLILCNLRLVVKIAKSYQSLGLDLLDLVQEGTIGLEHSIDKFNPSIGSRFTTYANFWIRKFVIKALDDNSRMIRLPQHIISLLSSIKKAYKALYLLDGESPSLLKVSTYLNIPEQKIRDILEISTKVSSINICISDRGERAKELLELIPAENKESVIDDLIIRDTLNQLILNLNVKEHQVIHLRYLQDTQSTFSEIGKILELSGEGVRKIESRAIKKLSESLNLVNS